METKRFHPITISLCMIVRNEEAVLGRCLDCAKQFADEIVVVDTGSTDKTMEIAGRYTDKIFQFTWIDDFAAARNFSFSKGTCDYLLWLDADDVVDSENIARLLELKREFPSDVDAAMFRYDTGFDETGAVTFSYFRERLVRRTGGFYWKEPVHEHLTLHGNIREYDIAITHGHKERAGGSRRNLRIYENIVGRGEALSSRGVFYFARELSTHGRYEEAACRFREFLDRPDGWVEDRINACCGLAECYGALGQPASALCALTASFAEDLPRAEACCRIGNVYLDQGKDRQAVFWFEWALQLPRPNGWGFCNEDYSAFIPHLQLCVLYDRMGRNAEARRHHEAAKQLRPTHRSVLYNELYFSQNAAR